MPLPILLCDQCDQPLTDKNTLSAIRNSIQRGFESWFRLSVEELLPTDTHCSNCDSSEFRKEATLIDGHFANLLQTIDNSDFKKALGGATSVMFVPQPSSSDAEWIKWLAEISVISAALTRSRPIKESQPFKQLKLSVMPKIGGEIEIDDTFLNKYPADVSRLVAITPNLSTQQITQQRLEKVAEDLLMEYQQLQTLFEHIGALLHGSLPSKEHKELNINGTDSSTADKDLTIDSLAVNVTAQLLQDVRQIYENGLFHETWKMLTDFCAQDLSFYVHAIEARDATAPHTTYETLTQISIALLQHFAPLTPFLAERFYQLISVDSKTDNHSIFEKNWHSVSPAIRQSLRASQTKKNNAKAEWEALGNAHNAAG